MDYIRAMKKQISSFWHFTYSLGRSAEIEVSRPMKQHVSALPANRTATNADLIRMFSPENSRRFATEPQTGTAVRG